MDRRILIVDGDAAEAEQLARALSRDGHRVEVVAEASHARRALADDAAPELLLLDLALPELDADSLLSDLEGSERRGLVPVIAIAPAGDPQARVRALRGGADDAVVRPCPADEVAARVVALLRLRAAHERLHAANEELERRSITDPLTGLFNRRYFEYRLGQELERSRRSGAPVAVALFDLDHFKRINDTHGHAVGDEVLLAVSRVLQQELRRADVCTRWGGEEFAAILPGTDASGARVVCGRVLRTLRAHAGVTASSPGPLPCELVRVTASAGVAAHAAGDAGGAEELLRSADAALYVAKRQGRNRVRVAPAGHAPAAAAMGPANARPQPAVA